MGREGTNLGNFNIGDGLPAETCFLFDHFGLSRLGQGKKDVSKEQIGVLVEANLGLEEANRHMRGEGSWGAVLANKILVVAVGKGVEESSLDLNHSFGIVRLCVEDRALAIGEGGKLGEADAERLEVWVVM